MPIFIQTSHPPYPTLSADDSPTALARSRRPSRMRCVKGTRISPTAVSIPTTDPSPNSRIYATAQHRQHQRARKHPNTFEQAVLTR